MNTKSKDKKYLGRAESRPRDLSITKTHGSYVFDTKGRRYVDFFMGWCVGNIGWSNPEVETRTRKIKYPTYVSPTYYYKEWAELAELLAKITPGKLEKTFRATGGTEAVEIALQAAMMHTGRHKFISIEGSYHGHSIGAMSIGSSDFRSWYKNLLPDCYKIKAPLNEQAAREVEKILSKGDIAAFISEPIICNIAVEIPEKKFFDIVQAACKKHGTLFVMDEVATGFGRTGKMFASEHYNLKPDIMCLAKGLTNGYGALGATIMTKEVAKSFEYDFKFYSTFGWHPANTVATLESLRYFIKNKKGLFVNAQKLSEYISGRLYKIDFRHKADIRVKGLAMAVVFKDKDYSEEIIKKSLKNGLMLADVIPGSFVIYPALDMSLKTAKEGMDILEKSV